MDNPLNEIECRVLACLYEKSITTPEYYPLTQNAMMLAANQKSNRNPVMNLSDAEVQAVVDTLKNRHLIWQLTTAGGRVPKYEHNFGAAFKLDAAQCAVLCELMVRGAQTAAELRANAGRMHAFAATADVEQVLMALQNRDDGALCTLLPRQSGQKESRYAHLLCGTVVSSVSVEASPVIGTAAPRDRVSVLEGEVSQLKADVQMLKEALAKLNSELGV